MSLQGGSTPARWVTRRSHLQISRNNVIPLIFKCRKSPSLNPQPMDMQTPPAYPETEVQVSDALPVVKDWLLEHIDRVYRVTPANLKPGCLETPDLLRCGSFRFTIWLEPTAAMFALLTPNKSDGTPAPFGPFDAFTPTPQTLHVTAELDA